MWFALKLSCRLLQTYRWEFSKFNNFEKAVNFFLINEGKNYLIKRFTFQYITLKATKSLVSSNPPCKDAMLDSQQDTLNPLSRQCRVFMQGVPRNMTVDEQIRMTSSKYWIRFKDFLHFNSLEKSFTPIYINL